MNTDLALLCALADTEFDGDSFNGPSLMTTLDSLSVEAATYAGTHERYNAWEVATHVLYFKYYIANAIGKAGPLEPYRYPKQDFAPPPDQPSDAAWRELLDYLRTAHRVCMDAIRSLPTERLTDTVPGWKTAFGPAIAWLCTHDSYHAAQLRNMGVPGLKAAKEG